MKLCTLIKNMHVHVEENDVAMNAAEYGLNGFFVEEDDTKI